MARPRRIAVVTGTRAEFGLLDPVMRAIAGHRALRLLTIVTGTHLTTGTWRDVRRAGHAIDAKIPMQRPATDGRLADVAALGRGITGFARALGHLRPDLVLVLGDRIEVLAAACAAAVAGIHLAHLHGGDRAEGVADESIRHATSKLAHLHFPATARSARRLSRMGEDRRHIYQHGSPAIDRLAGVIPAPDAPDIIVMQHPIGDTDALEARRMRSTLAATAGFDRLIMAPNHDPGRAGIMRAIGRRPHTDHLPRDRFLALLAGARALVGNSSAGLIEAAALRTAAVNIGTRQGGREKPANVIDCDHGRQPVAAALHRALNLDLRRMRQPYGRGDTGPRIAETLATIDLAAVPIRKQNTY